MTSGSGASFINQCVGLMLKLCMHTKENVHTPAVSVPVINRSPPGNRVDELHIPSSKHPHSTIYGQCKWMCIEWCRSLRGSLAVWILAHPSCSFMHECQHGYFFTPFPNNQYYPARYTTRKTTFLLGKKSLNFIFSLKTVWYNRCYSSIYAIAWGATIIGFEQQLSHYLTLVLIGQNWWGLTS